MVNKCDQDVSEAGKGNVDDLSKLSYLDEQKLIEELCVRYKNGQIYVRNEIIRILWSILVNRIK